METTDINVDNAIAHTKAVAQGEAGRFGRELTSAEHINAVTATSASIAAFNVTRDSRKLETRDALKEVLASQEGRHIISDIVYDGVVKALNDRSPNIHSTRY